jgi:hypothetical protein
MDDSDFHRLYPDFGTPTISVFVLANFLLSGLMNNVDGVVVPQIVSRCADYTILLAIRFRDILPGSDRFRSMRDFS